MPNPYLRVARMKTAQDFRDYVAELGIHLPIDEKVEPAPDGALAQTYTLKTGRVIGNRFSILPMEGWDGTPDGFENIPPDFVASHLLEDDLIYQSARPSGPSPRPGLT